MGALS